MILNTNVQPARPSCGTASGYRLHIRHGEKPCGECRVAWRGYIRKYRAKKGRR